MDIDAVAYAHRRPGFYLTFWQLSAYDLMPPTAKYEEASQSAQRVFNDHILAVKRMERNEKRKFQLLVEKHKMEKDRYQKVVDALSMELREQLAVRAYTIKRIAREKLHWFAHSEHSSLRFSWSRFD